MSATTPPDPHPGPVRRPAGDDVERDASGAAVGERELDETGAAHAGGSDERVPAERVDETGGDLGGVGAGAAGDLERER